MKIRKKTRQHLQCFSTRVGDPQQQSGKMSRMSFILYLLWYPPKKFYMRKDYGQRRPIQTDHMIGCARRTHLSPLEEDKTFIIHLWLHCLWIMSLAPLLVVTNLLSQQTAVAVMQLFFRLIDTCQKISVLSYLYLTNTSKCSFLWHKTRLDGNIRYIQLKSFEYPLYLFISFRIQVLNHFLGCKVSQL